MSGKNSRSGGKYGKSHTTLIEPAANVCDIANKIESVNRISIGLIKAGLRSSGGKTRVKISIKPGAMNISIRGNSANQDIHLYGSEFSHIEREIRRGIKKLGYNIK